MNLKLFLILSITFFISNCGKPNPTFNPFDNLFDIDISKIRNDTTLEIVGDCMAFMHIKDFGTHKSYYTIYTLSKKNSVAGKGLNIPITGGKIKIPIDPKLNRRDSIFMKRKKAVLDSIKNLPFNTLKVDSILAAYNLKRTDKITKFNLFSEENEQFWIYENLEKKKFPFKIEIHHLSLSKYFVVGARKLNYDTFLSWENLNDNQLYK